MLKQLASLEIVREDRVYSFQLPANCPLGEVHDVLFQMRSFIVDRINEAAKADEPQKPQEQIEQPKAG